MRQADTSQNPSRWRSLIFVSGFLVYQAYRYVLIAIFCFPVAACYVISGLLLDPAIPANSKHQLFKLIIDRFDQVFYYSVTMSLLLALAVSLLGLFKYYLGRLNNRRKASAV